MDAHAVAAGSVHAGEGRSVFQVLCTLEATLTLPNARGRIGRCTLFGSYMKEVGSLMHVAMCPTLAFHGYPPPPHAGFI